VKSSTIYYTVTSLSDNVDNDKDANEYEPPERFLRFLFEFVKSQLKYLRKSKQEDVYFVNILDGNIASSPDVVSRFESLCKQEKHASVAHLVFCGDLATFREWYASTITS
jgi:hypothetical protein